MNKDKLESGLLEAVKKYDSLLCKRCSSVMRLDDRRKASFFTHGWPECCGETMALHIKEKVGPRP